MDVTTIILIVVFLVGLAIAYYIGQKAGSFQERQIWEEELPKQRKEAIMQSRAVLGGQFSEQLAPFLPNFDNLPTECRFIGKPIDFIVFKGMDEKKISEVVFVEVKSGNARTSPVEKSLKDTIENKRVRWEEYRIPDELTKKKDIEDDIKSS